MSLSIGVSTEKTVVGLLNELDTEYQIVGDAVTEAHLLAATLVEVGAGIRWSIAGSAAMSICFS